MREQVKKAVHQIEQLPGDQQDDIARRIMEELSWEAAFENTQEQLERLAKEAIKEYRAGKTSSEEW